MKRVLIFGAAGFVGSYLSQEFIENGYKVYGSDKNQGSMLPKEVKFSIVDVLDVKQIEWQISKISPDIIINLAAISSVGASWNIPQLTISVNVVGALNILEVVKQSKKKPKVMFVGSSEEYMIADVPMDEKTSLNAGNPYGISKITQEQFAKLYRERYGLKVYYVRSFNHTGVGQSDSFVIPSFCKQIADIEKLGKPGIIKVGNLTVKRDFSHVKDVVRAYRLIVENDNCDIVYNVGSGKAYSLKNLLEYIVGSSKQKIDIAVDLSRFRPTDQPVICCDHSLITLELGWQPKYTVFDAIDEMLEYYRKN